MTIWIDVQLGFRIALYAEYSNDSNKPPCLFLTFPNGGLAPCFTSFDMSPLEAPTSDRPLFESKGCDLDHRVQRLRQYN